MMVQEWKGMERYVQKSNKMHLECFGNYIVKDTNFLKRFSQILFIKPAEYLLMQNL